MANEAREAARLDPDQPQDAPDHDVWDKFFELVDSMPGTDDVLRKRPLNVPASDAGRFGDLLALTEEDGE